MLKKNSNKLFIALACTALALSLSTISSVSTYYADGEEGGQNPETTEPSYYVVFKNQNYNIKNSNKMEKDGESYILKNISLTSDNDFYVVDNNENRYESSSESPLSINETTAYKYNILFSGSRENTYNGTFDKDYHPDAEVTNATVSYEFYIPGSYTLHYNNEQTEKMIYNPYQANYEGYYVTGLDFNANSELYVTDDNDNNKVVSNLVDEANQKITSQGKYRIYFTPDKVTSSDTYRFDENGNYGTGEDYKYNLKIDDYEVYKIKFDTKLNDAQVIDNEYSLTRDEKQPNAEVYKSESFFNNAEDKKVKYHLYYTSSITGNTKEIEDAVYDDDKEYSRITLSNAGYYTFSLTVASDNYTTTASQDDSDFEGYAMIGEFNDYGFDAEGKVQINGHTKKDGEVDTNDYFFKKITGEEGSDNYDLRYTEDYDQYIIKDFELTKDMLDEDDGTFSFTISNGEDTYRNGTDDIVLSIPGKYEILFSPSHTYATNNNYQFKLTDNYSDGAETYEINSEDDFISYIYNWNVDSENSKFNVFNLNCDLDFKDKTLDAISVFSGTLNGNGYTIKNITLNVDDNIAEPGLFTLVSQYGVIQDLKFENLDIESEDSSYVGLISKNYGTIKNVEASGKIIGNQYVGLVSYNGNYDLDSKDTTDSTIKYGYGKLINVTNNCSVEGKINVGGLTGFNGGKIVDSTNKGTVNNRSYPSSSTVTNIGGLAGYHTGEIVNSINQGTIGYKNIGSNVGGIAGLSAGEIYFTYNDNIINGKYYVGGLVGYYGAQQQNNQSEESDLINDTINDYLGTNSDTLPYTEERDISSHLIDYCYNTKRIDGSSYVGGLIGYNNATNLTLKNSFSKSDCYANSGSYVGGIAGYSNGGTYQSIFSQGYYESNGSTNQYVGGLIGYTSGEIIYAYTSSVISGSDYLGGLVGYGTSASKISSSYSNSLIISKNNSNYIGNIAGCIDGRNDASATYDDRIEYNYYLGNEKYADNGGINRVNYGFTSKYAAMRIADDDFISKNTLNDKINHNFGNEENDDGDNEYYFVASSLENKYPQLDSFINVDDIDDDDFDDDGTYEKTFEEYFNSFVNTYKDYQDNASQSLVHIAYLEWDEDNGGLDDFDNYNIVKVYEVKHGEDYPQVEDYVSATKDGDTYYYQGDDAKYIVTYSSLNNEFMSQVVYSKYTEIYNSMMAEDKKVIVEGEFTSANKFTYSEENGTYTLALTKDGTTYTSTTDLVVKVNINSPSDYEVYVGDQKVDSSIYGEYIKFTLSANNSSFTLKKKGIALTTTSIIIIIASGVVILGAISAIIIAVTHKKKNKTTKK